MSAGPIRPATARLEESAAADPASPGEPGAPAATGGAAAGDAQAREALQQANIGKTKVFLPHSQ